LGRSSLERVRPPLVALTLLQAEFRRIGLVAAGVDAHFYHRAQSQGLPTLQFESAAAQLEFIVNMGRGQEDALILSTLKDIVGIDETMAQVVAAWREGDHQLLNRVLLEPMRLESPELYRALVVNRNRQWLPSIEAQLADPGVELVLVGALHLLGKDGLLQSLRRAGYQVEPYLGRGSDR